MVNLNSEQEQVLAKLTEVGKQRKALKDDIKRYSDMVTAAWEVEFGKYLAQALNLGIPKTRLARAYGTTDPYTVPKLADRVLEEHNGTYSLKHTALAVPSAVSPAEPTPADPPPLTDSDGDLGVRIVGKSESLVEVAFSQWTPTHDPAPGCNEGCTTTQTYGPHVFEWKWSTVANPPRPMIMRRQDRQALPTWFMHERGTDWFKDQLAQAWAEVNTNTV